MDEKLDFILNEKKSGISLKNVLEKTSQHIIIIFFVSEILNKIFIFNVRLKII
jgi:hypothetical protein